MSREFLRTGNAKGDALLIFSGLDFAPGLDRAA